MPELGNQLLDVVLGLALIFLVLSLLCSLLQEMIATAFSWRARFLERGIRSMLDGDDTKAGPLSRAVTESPFVREKLRKRRLLWPGLRVPAYLPSTTFARALIETARSGRWPKELPDDVERKLSELMQEADGDLQQLKDSLQDWYDATMQRVSAWYKRRARIWLFIFGVFVAGVANADLVDVTERLWRDDAVRTAVARQADRVAEAQSVEQIRENLRAEIERTGDTPGRDQAVRAPGGLERGQRGVVGPDPRLDRARRGERLDLAAGDPAHGSRAVLRRPVLVRHPEPGDARQRRSTSAAPVTGGPDRRMIVVSVSAAPRRRRKARSRASSSAVSLQATRSW